LCNGTCLDDIELRRNDSVFLDAIGADRIPDPTTAGDFCRRFTAEDIETLQDVFDQTRVRLWKQQPPAFFDEAVIDVDGTLVATGARCKQGIDIAYDGTWGYHPLLVSLANTGEVLRLVNRPGNRPSHEGPPSNSIGSSCSAVEPASAASPCAVTPTSPRPGASTPGTTRP
jgi:hypothetical protein